MTKKEAAEVERVKHELRLKGALRATTPAEPDIPIPESDSLGLTTGFVFEGDTCAWPRVEPACSSFMAHGIGRNDRTSSRGGIRLFSTRLLALMALRYAVEQDCCIRLARVDSWIEEEKVSG